MSEITKAMQQLCDEKGLSYEAVLEAIQFALGAAYRKDFGNKQQNIKVIYNPEDNSMKAWDVKNVVEDIEEEVLVAAQEELAARREKAKMDGVELSEEDLEDLPRFNPKTEMMLTEAKEHKKKVKVGEVLEIELEVKDEFGRMAAQTAKQVIIQKVREAERNNVFDDFKNQEGELIMGTVQRVEGRKVLIDFGKVTGILPSDQQIRRDIYRPGARMKFLILSVEMSTRGPQIILSRSGQKFVEEVLKQEIPEIAEEVIDIKGIARDAGFRSKVAVYTDDDSIDPIGSCIGQRGGRINTIIEELSGEKVDVVMYSEDSEDYIINSLSPAKISQVELDEEKKEATVLVESDQFSLAIGRGGQNVRLAAELTGWGIKVKELGGDGQEVSSDEKNAERAEKAAGKKEDGDEKKTDEVEESDDKESKDEKVEETKEEEKGEEKPVEKDDSEKEVKKVKKAKKKVKEEVEKDEETEEVEEVKDEKPAEETSEEDSASDEEKVDEE